MAYAYLFWAATSRAGPRGPIRKNVITIYRSRLTTIIGSTARLKIVTRFYPEVEAFFEDKTGKPFDFALSE